MSIFDDTISALSGAVPPLHQAVSNANQAMQKATGHLGEALDHLARDFQQALQDKATAEAALADATRRVDELRQAALHLASVGQGIETLLGVGQEAAQSPSPEQIPQAADAVEQVVTEAEAAVEDVKEAVDAPSA